MKRRTLVYLALAILGALFALQLTGCSMFLGTLGLIIDNAHAQQARIVPPERVATIRAGEEIALTLAGGRELSGQMAGLARIEPAPYATRYRPWQAGPPDGARYPALGESVEVVRPDGSRDSGVFAGFGFRSVLLEGARPEAPREHAFADISSLVAGERTFTADSLIASALALGLPSRDAIAIHVVHGATEAERKANRSRPKRSSVTADGGVTLRIPTDEASRVTLYHHGHPAMTGFVIGLAVDVLVIAAAASFSNGYSSIGCEPTYTGYTLVHPGGTAWDPRTGRAAPRGAH